LSIRWSVNCAPMFNLLANQQLFENNLCNQMKIMDDFHCKQKPSCATTIFAVSKKMNGIQRRMLVSTWRMHCICTIQYAKRHLSSWNNIKQQKIKPIASIILLSYTWMKGSSSQSINQCCPIIILEAGFQTGDVWQFSWIFICMYVCYCMLCI